MGSNEGITQFEKKKKALHGWRKLSKCAVIVGVEGDFSLQLLRDEIAFNTRGNNHLYFIVVLFSLQPSSQASPLAFEMQREVLGTFGIHPNIADFGLMEKSIWWHTKLFLAISLGSLSFSLHHQLLERDLENLGCFLMHCMRKWN